MISLILAVALNFIFLSEAASLSLNSPNIRILHVTGPHYLCEGPHWDADAQVLYFVDLPRQTLYCYDPATKRETYAYTRNGQLGAVVPVCGRPNMFIGAAGTDFVQITWDPRTSNLNPKIDVIATVDSDRRGTRVNDGKADLQGRFWAGTMGINLEPGLGSLYRMDTNLRVTRVVSPVSISNGLAWSNDCTTFYYIDSPTRQVWAYDFDARTGDIGYGKFIFNFDQHNIPGIPDGMTIDTLGNLWVACYDGGMVICIHPATGLLLRRVYIPAMQVTSVAFGGPNLDILFVTTGRQRLRDVDLVNQPQAGSVFAVMGLNVFGLRSNTVAVHPKFM